MRMLICRHGHTPRNIDSNGNELVRGWDEVSLSYQGRMEALELAKQIERRYNVSMVYTSDLARAMETAEFIADHTKGQVVPSIGLRTWHLGELEGKPVKEVLRELQHFDTHPDECPRGGETKNFFLARLSSNLDEIMSDSRKRKSDTIMVTHGRCFAAIPGILSGSGRTVPYTGVPKTGALALLKPDGKQWKMTVFSRELRTLAMREGFPGSHILCCEF